MKDSLVSFICSSCGAIFSRWQGRCTQCGNWNTIEETKVLKTKVRSHLNLEKATSISGIRDGDDFARLETGIEEFDRVLGTGIVPGSVVLLGGDPGIGKSTLILQVSSKISDKKKRVLYVTGEESVRQVGIRAHRLVINSENLFIIAELNLEIAIEQINKEAPLFVIIDSIQTIFSDEIGGTAGGVAQITYCTQKLISVAKEKNIAILIIGHVTKDGSLAGPKILEHLVDVVLYLEGNRYGGFRVLRGIKNRFGPTNEAGIFEMNSSGLEEVKNPSEMLLAERDINTSGIAVFPMMEGTRPLLVEIQALVSVTSFGYPKRTASGMDINRLQLLIAILSKRLNLNLSNQDVYINIVGGLTIKEPALDLAIVLALISAYKNKPLNPDVAIFGEVGLAGEVRNVNNIEERIREARKLGFKRIIVPYAAKKEKSANIFLAKNIEEASREALL